MSRGRRVSAHDYGCACEAARSWENCRIPSFRSRFVHDSSTCHVTACCLPSCALSCRSGYCWNLEVQKVVDELAGRLEQLDLCDIPQASLKSSWTLTNYALAVIWAGSFTGGMSPLLLQSAKVPLTQRGTTLELHSNLLGIQILLASKSESSGSEKDPSGWRLPDESFVSKPPAGRGIASTCRVAALFVLACKQFRCNPTAGKFQTHTKAKFHALVGFCNAWGE